MPYDHAEWPDEPLDPYSAQVAHAFETVGPAVVHIAAVQANGHAVVPAPSRSSFGVRL